MPAEVSGRRTGPAGELWPVLLLVVVVAVPTVGVLWFAGVAMDNQQLAARQRLSDAYRSHLENVQRKVDSDWRDSSRQIEAMQHVDEGPRLFANVVLAGIVDSAVCCDNRGQVEYPTVVADSEETVDVGSRWSEARRQENELADVLSAAAIYGEIAGDAPAASERIAAIQAQVRCLLRADQTDAAMQLVVRSQEGHQFDSLPDARTRAVAANIQLVAIEHATHADEFARVRDHLVKVVHDYSERSLASAHRLFLMKRLNEIAPDQVDHRLLDAEDLAARFVARHPNLSRVQAVEASLLPGIWQASTPNHRMVLLLKETTIVDRVMRAAAMTTLPSDARIHVMPPGEEPLASAFLTLPAGICFPGWRLALTLSDENQVDAVALQRHRLYLWTGILTVMSSSILAIFIARAFRRQIRLANLKNDLVGTVSHELKTPLSSMRLLVDTLLDDERFEESRTREYLRLIAKENSRLSRLIENFLTFTRMEQNPHLFQFRRVKPEEIVTEAVEAVGERFQDDNGSLTVQVDQDLPCLFGDKDGLVTVLLNLLDNAYKYSSDERDVTLQATAGNGFVSFSVADRGIGMTRTVTRRVFQRFYQVDQSLARERKGCGLGLSIVQTIVDAHHGSVEVRSSLGIGSTFTVRIPVADKHLIRHEEAID